MSYVRQFNDDISKTLHGLNECVFLGKLLNVDPTKIATMTWNEIRQVEIDQKERSPELVNLSETDQKECYLKLVNLLETLDSTKHCWFAKPTTQINTQAELDERLRSWAGYGNENRMQEAVHLPERCPEELVGNLDMDTHHLRNCGEDVMQTVEMNVANHLRNCAYALNISKKVLS